jgi:N-acylneuraminate cytidylyltransferase
MGKIAFFLPTRKGSERVKNKNTKPFAGIEGGLIEHKIRQLVHTQLIDEIILSTNDETCMAVASKYAADSRLKIIPRPEELCLSSTNLQDLIKYVPTITDADHIMWGHVTTPLCGAADYDEGIQSYLSQLANGFDSLVGVKELKNFLLDKCGKVINNTTSIPWPRTQDLETLYEINHTMFIAKRTVYTDLCNRIGEKPLLHVMDEMTSFDIDWPEDFLIAEIMYKYKLGNDMLLNVNSGGVKSSPVLKRWRIAA